MQIKRYEMESLQQALARIKRDLGPDAIILSSKKLSVSPPLIEIIAARDEKEGIPVSPDTKRPCPAPPQEDACTSLVREVQDLKSSIHGLVQQLARQTPCSDMKETIDTLVDNLSAGYPAPLRDIYLRLTVNGISRPRSMQLINAIRNNYPSADTDTYEKGALIAEQLIARSLTKDKLKERRIKAFIGPTGVGKTTTLAKLAAHYSLEKKMNVGLITTDTFRIAASEQLKIYAKIMGLPIHIASHKDVFIRSLSDFADKDMILVDTPGHNPSDHRCLNHLRDLLIPGIESVLLLCPVASREYLLHAADLFKIFNYDRIILTKVDECSHFGSMYDVLDEIGKPVSYLTTGQNVPKDIEKTTPEKLARMILQNGLH